MVELNSGHVELHYAGPIKIILYLKLSFKSDTKSYFNKSLLIFLSTFHLLSSLISIWSTHDIDNTLWFIQVRVSSVMGPKEN